jgi:hypothetical protein
MAVVTTLTWLSLAVFLVCLIGGLTLAGVRALAAWRAFRLLQRRVGDALADATRRLAETETRVTGVSEAIERLDEARRRLQAGLAVAALLAGATGDTRAVVGRIRGLVPRK